MNTKEKGMLSLDENQISQNRKTIGNLGIYEIFDL